MAQSKTLHKKYKGFAFTLKRNDRDFGDKWTVESDAYIAGPYPTKKMAIEFAHYAIDQI